ncbi:MAG: hypothetical protein A3J48_00655 [Candidatus Doudnabacteria bacterium RIFCSPHIGHO2_02_FULL_46_11]|uniref:histidine kinase n=1 Tax=Candidatus Doudnabacteria bacterium RIFCSPHIGHO2_02_FULL_46_11 TaxID=1817832 RepID=A0A1F5P541_9BACT|nr:MAG: hypothetical protein A3J48_00655 [Candidatus Doudnabacteria bacterium RIFCSPHIGHO2_02_FULL_46_11]
MNVLNFSNFDLLAVGVAIAATGILCFVVFLNDRKSVTNKSFALFALATIFYGVVNYLNAHSPSSSPTWILWILRMTIFSAVLHAFSLYILFYVFPKPAVNFSKKYKFVLLPVVIGVAILTLTPSVFSQVTVVAESGVTNPERGPAMPIFGMVVTFLIMASIVNIFRKTFRASGVERNQLKFVLIGTIISFSLLILLNVVLPLAFNVLIFIPLAPVWILPFIILTAYSIIKYHLLDVKLIATEIVAFLLSVAILVEVVFSEGVLLVGLRFLGFLVVLAFSILLIRGVRKEVSQREQLQSLAGQLRQANTDLLLRNRYLAALQELTGEITRSLNFKKFTQEIVDGIANKMDFIGGVLMLLDKDDETLKFSAISDSSLTNRAIALVPKQISDYTGNIKTDNNLTVLAMRSGRVQLGTELAGFISPPLPKGVAAILQNAIRARAVIAAPIFSENKAIGCLLVLSRTPKEQILQAETQMVKALADEVGIMARNLTLYEQLETVNNQLVSANDQLSKLDKAKTEFLSIASHQLRTPLTAIKGYLSMVKEGDYGKLPETMASPLDNVAVSAERLIGLVNDLLDVSRIASGRLELHMQRTDIVSMARDVIQEIKPKADNKNISLILTAQSIQEIFVKADGEKLRQVVINMIDNAIKYTEKGSVTISFEKTPNKLRFMVADTGIGIAPEDISQLFQRFVRTKEARLVVTEGTGLGLYVARTTIEAMGGKIWAESEGLGRGSRFIFELSLAADDYKEEIINVAPRQDYAVN